MTLLFAVTKVNAQAHNMQPGWCKYAKKAKGQAKDESESAVCQVCRKENEKEKTARAAEDKRRNDVAVAKGKADKAASDLAYKKTQAEIAAKNKVTEVHVTMPKTTATETKKTEPPVKKKPVKLGKDIQLYAGWGMGMFTHNSRTNFFLNEINDTVLKSNDYLETYAVWRENKNNFPKNIGIVLLKETNKISNGRELNVADIIDLKGKRYFNDNTISTIFHLADDYFVVCKSPTIPEWRSYGNNYTGYENVEIYNLKTKKSIKLDKDAGRFVSISIYVGGRKMPGDPDLTPFLSRLYSNYDEDVYCLNANREMVVKKILKANR